MSFLQPILLIGLPLALLPIIIHLINQHRHRTVKWAAMMFLLDAKKMTKGLARLRQILILAMRVIAVAMLLFAASRPLAGGWLALTGGKADTVILLLDRSASMEQQNLQTGISKRSAAVEKLSDLVSKTGGGTEVILIDSATLEPIRVTDVSALADLPQTAPTATASNIPALFRKALDFIQTDSSGRTDLWLATDLRREDWAPAAGEWQSIRSELSASENTRLFLLTFPEIESDNLSIAVSNVKRRRSASGLQLVLDLSIKKQGVVSPDAEEKIPVEFTVNGTRTVQEMVLKGEEMIRLGHTIPLGNSDARGWARFDLPADDNVMDNRAYLVFDDPAEKRTSIVGDDVSTAEAIRAAAISPVDSSIEYSADIFPVQRTAELPWSESALIVWHAPLPGSGSTEAALLEQHVSEGRALLLLPPEQESPENDFLGLRWGEWLTDSTANLEIGWWRTESGLLANTQNGSPLPLGELKLYRTRQIVGEVQSLLKLESGETVVGKVIPDKDSNAIGHAYFWGTLPRSEHSTLASDGVAFFVMIHRALDEGAQAVSKAKSSPCRLDALPDNPMLSSLDSFTSEEQLLNSNLVPGAFEIESETGDSTLVALHRPVSEDRQEIVSEETLGRLLEGIDYRQISDRVDSGSSLASEIWRTFLIAMALALLAEAALCLPPKTEPQSKSERAMA